MGMNCMGPPIYRVVTVQHCKCVFSYDFLFLLKILFETERERAQGGRRIRGRGKNRLPAEQGARCGDLIPGP